MIGTATPVDPNRCVCIPSSRVSRRLSENADIKQPGRQKFHAPQVEAPLARLGSRQGFAYAGKLAQQLELGSTEKGRSRTAGALDSQLDAILRLFALLNLGDSPLFLTGQKLALQALEPPGGFQR